MIMLIVQTDLAPQHPFTKALKDFGSDHLHKEKEVKVEVFSNGKKLTLAQLEKEYQDWILQMHSQYDEEFNCGDDEPVMLVNASNKEAFGIKSDVVRVHQAMSRKGRSWGNGQRIKILKGACPGCHKSNTYATLEYFLLEGFQGDVGGEARIICRPLGVPDQNGCKLTVDAATSTHLELHSSLSLPIVVIDSGKCIPVDMNDWNLQLEKLNLKAPSTIDVLGLKQCKELDINGALPTETQVSAGSLPPKEVVAVLRPSNFSSSSVPNDLDQKYIIRDNYEMCMEIKFMAKGAKLCNLDLVFSGSVTNTSRKGVNGLYVFDLTSISSLFQKAGVYLFSFSLKNSACKGCEVRVRVKASSTIKRWALVKDDQHPQYIVRAGSCFRSLSVTRFDMYDNCVPFKSVPEIVVQLEFNGGILCHIKKVNVDLSSDNFHMIVRNARITTNNLDKIRPSYEATLVLSQSDKVPILRIPCRVMPGPLQSVTFHPSLPSESGKGLLPKQVVLDAKLEMFDRHGNHVNQGTKVDLAVHGFCLMDQNGVKRKADNLGCIDLGGVLKVTGAYGESVSLSVLSDKDVIFTKIFHVQKRELTIATDVPEPCHPGSKLKDIAFKVVNSKGEVDQSIHDEDKHSQSHTLTIKTDLPNFDNSLRYAFRHGQCVIPSIALPRREGSFYIEAVHSHHQELHLKFKVNVSQAIYTEKDADLHVSGEMHDEGISQPSDEEITPLPVSFAPENVVAVPQSQNKEYAVINPVQAPRKEQGETMFQLSDGKFMLHRDSLSVNSAANSTRSKVQDKQGTPTKTPLRQYDPNDELSDEIFQSPEGKIISLDCFTPQHAITQIGPHLWDLQDVEKEIYNCGLEIKEYEEDLKSLQIYRDTTVLELQASMELQLLDRSDYMSQKEVMSGKIENKVGSAAAVYSISTRDMTLKEKDLKIMSNMVGVVACLGTTASPLLSRLLAEYLGEDQMLAIVCQSCVTTPEDYERALNSVAAELGKHIKGSYLLICLEDIRPYAGDVRTSDPQKRLDIPKPELPDGKTPPGFLGYAVNMVEIDVDHLETKTAAGYGIRETLFYGLFGELQVYDRKENMEHARGCIKDGAVSLDGGIIRGNGIISLGCKQVDVHFPVADVDQRLIICTESKEIIRRLVERKKAADEAIAYTYERRSKCVKQFQESQSGFLKLLEEKEASSQKLRFSQEESLKTSPMPSQTPAHY